MDLDQLRLECVDQEIAELLRAKTPAQRLEIAFSLWRSARKMLTCLLESQHPDWNDVQVTAEVARRMSGGTR